MELMPARPPHARFEMVEMEDRDASIAAGMYVPKNIPHAVITSAGGKDSVHKRVDEWLKQLKFDATNGRCPMAWFDHFSRAYEEWEKGNEIPEFGTPILTFLVFTPQQRAALIAANIRTVEDCAEMNADTMGRVGMGALDLKNKAIAALSSANQQVAIIEDLGVKLAAKDQVIDNLKEQIALLRAELQDVQVGSTKRRAAA